MNICAVSPYILKVNEAHRLCASSRDELHAMEHNGVKREEHTNARYVCARNKCKHKFEDVVCGYPAAG